MQRNGFYGGQRLLWALCAKARTLHTHAHTHTRLRIPSHAARSTRALSRCQRQYHEYWAARGTPLPPSGFRLSYDTNIPKQAGLSGSSAIVTAALSALEAHFGPSFALPRETRPGLVLAAEAALGITAGLQDRVVQTYEGVVYMVRVFGR